MSILILAEISDKCEDSTLKTISAAQTLNLPITVLAVGTLTELLKTSLQSLPAEKVIFAEQNKPSAEFITNVLKNLAEGFTHIFAPATAFGKNVLPRLAALLDVMQISDVIRIENANTFTRPIYAGNALETVESSDSKILATIRPANFPLCGQGAAQFESLSNPEAPARTAVFEREEKTVSARPELSSAKVVISGGRALQSAEQFQSILEPLADQLNAAIGASRAAVDAGYAPNDYQVGQTGKVVAPDLYIAIGISGAVQHLAGMKDSRTIVAINKDKDAPIFQVADYGLVGDLYTLIPELQSALASAGYPSK